MFKIVADGSRATLAPLYGALRGILVSDRAAALAFLAMERRQICWAGRRDRATFLAWMAPVQAQVEAVLERAVASGIDRLAGSCANILAHRAALWTFVHLDSVEPTNKPR